MNPEIRQDIRDLARFGYTASMIAFELHLDAADVRRVLRENRRKR